MIISKKNVGSEANIVNLKKTLNKVFFPYNSKAKTTLFKVSLLYYNKMCRQRIYSSENYIKDDLNSKLRNVKLRRLRKVTRGCCNEIL